MVNPSLLAALVGIRHCEPDFSAIADAANPNPETALCLGQLDLALSAHGQAHALQIAAHLPVWVKSQRLQPLQIVCSDLLRAQQTAEAIAAALQCPITCDPRWRELDMGSFTGRAWQEIHQNNAQELARWGENYVREGPPGGESFLQLQARVQAALTHLLGANQHTLIIAHAGSLRAASACLRGFTPERAMQLPWRYGETKCLTA